MALSVRGAVLVLTAYASALSIMRLASPWLLLALAADLALLSGMGGER